MAWTVENNVGDLSGNVIVVTGANSGVGFETAKIFCQKGAEVIMGCRSRERGAAALEKIKAQVPDAKLHLILLDLSSLKSVQSFVDEFNQQFTVLNILVNNAGVMALPKQLTEDNFEFQTGVNYFGHYALTAKLMPNLKQAKKGARIISLTSAAHWLAMTGPPFKDIKYENGYNTWVAYCQSKLLNVLFAKALNRKLKENGLSHIKSIAAHPGYADSGLQRHSLVFSTLNKCFTQNCYMGSLPSVRAATDDKLVGGEVIGPRFVGWGAPTLAGCLWHANQKKHQDRLFAESEKLTGFVFQDFQKGGKELAASNPSTNRL